MLSAYEIRALLDRLKTTVVRPECWSCDCLQGFLTQIEMDADDVAARLITPLKVGRDSMHGCLGCEPCPPGEVYSDHLRRLNSAMNQCGPDKPTCDCKKERTR